MKFSQTLSVLLLGLFSFILVSCSATEGEKKFVAVGATTFMNRATSDIQPGEAVRKEAFKHEMVKFEPGQERYESVSSEEILIGLKPIKKISKGDLIVDSFFDLEEVKAKEQEVIETRQ